MRRANSLRELASSCWPSGKRVASLLLGASGSESSPRSHSFQGISAVALPEVWPIRSDSIGHFTGGAVEHLRIDVEGRIHLRVAQDRRNHVRGHAVPTKKSVCPPIRTFRPVT